MCVGKRVTPLRSYDPATGRFQGVDILADSYASLTPYQFAFNDPVFFSDPSGATPVRRVGDDFVINWDECGDYGGTWHNDGGGGSFTMFGSTYDAISWGMDYNKEMGTGFGATSVERYVSRVGRFAGDGSSWKEYSYRAKGIDKNTGWRTGKAIPVAAKVADEKAKEEAQQGATDEFLRSFLAVQFQKVPGEDGLMCISFATPPGYTYDGKAFIGKDGKRLSGVTLAAGDRKSDVHITPNSVKDLRALFLTVGHELIHVSHNMNGLNNINSSEYGAYEWTIKAGQLNGLSDQQLQPYINELNSLAPSKDARYSNNHIGIPFRMVSNGSY